MFVVTDNNNKKLASPGSLRQKIVCSDFGGLKATVIKKMHVCSNNIVKLIVRLLVHFDGANS